MSEPPSLLPWGAGPSGPKFKGVGRQGRLVLGLVGLFIALAAIASASVFIVNPTELAFTRTFGRVDEAPNAPLLPGVHLMIPFVTIVDRMQVSVDTVALPNELHVLSHDGQAIQLGVSLTRRVPPDAVYNLLYNTGSVGNVDIDHNIFAIVSDRTLTIFGREDVLNIASDRERIIGLMKNAIAGDLRRLFGVELVDLQITGFRFSPEYERAVNENTLAKTNAYRAEQVLKEKEVQARQAVAEAKGRADAAIETARGESVSALLRARATGQATEIQAAADADAIKLRVAAAGGIDGYGKVLAADTMKLWNGHLPQTMFSGPGAPMPFVQVH